MSIDHSVVKAWENIYGETLTLRQVPFTNSATYSTGTDQQMARKVTATDELRMGFYIALGWSCNAIARELDLSSSTVADYTRPLRQRMLWTPREQDEDKQKKKEVEDTVRGLSSPPITASFDPLRDFVRAATLQDPRASSERIAAAASSELSIQTSRETIRKLRHEIGFKWLDPIRIPNLGNVHKQARADFAREFLEAYHNVGKIAPIVFTDEPMVRCTFDGKLWRIPGALEENYCCPQAHHPVQVMVWGAIGPGYKSKLIRLEGAVTAKSYKTMLEASGVLADIDQRYGPWRWIYQQDNASPHVTKENTDWISQRAHLLIGWPPYSPDLSPIEQIWAILKSNFRKRARDEHVTHIDEDTLFGLLERTWESISDDIVTNLTNSFLARLNICLKYHGACLNGRWGEVRHLEKEMGLPKIAYNATRMAGQPGHDDS